MASAAKKIGDKSPHHSMHPRHSRGQACKKIMRVLPKILFGVFLLGLATASPARVETGIGAFHQKGELFLGVRVLKVAGAKDLKWSASFSPGCARCRLVINRYTASQNAREFFFHAWVTSNSHLGSLTIKVDPTAVRKVLVSFTDTRIAQRGYTTTYPRAQGPAQIAFVKRADSISFQLPLRLHGASIPPDDIQDISQNYTYIETPGVYIRVAHADPQRRSGPYSSGPWPSRQAAAALNLEFAAREAITALKLDKNLSKLGITTIMLMNFDTNYPTLGPDAAHEDWPPHWHMHLFWTDAPRVRKVAHFYLSEEGLLTGDLSSDLTSVLTTARANRWVPEEVANETRTSSGVLVYGQAITKLGFFELSTQSGSCLISPEEKGFDTGAIVTCNHNAVVVHVRAEDDPAVGLLKLRINNDRLIEYHYDRDSGVLMKSSCDKIEG